MTLTRDTHKKGAHKNAYPNTEIALTMPSGYHGNAMTKRTPVIPIQGAKTGRIGSKKALIGIEERAKEPSKQRDQPISG